MAFYPFIVTRQQALRVWMAPSCAEAGRFVSGGRSHGRFRPFFLFLGLISSRFFVMSSIDVLSGLRIKKKRRLVCFLLRVTEEELEGGGGKSVLTESRQGEGVGSYRMNVLGK